LRRCRIFYARNIDMLLLAVVVRRVTGARAAIAYEVLDVQRVFIGDGPVNKFFRWAERRLLAVCDLLVVSSPDFISHYFVPTQKLAGPWQLLENKVFTEHAADAPAPGQRPAAGPPWVIGWFGTLRCVRSLEILCRVADALGDRVAVHIRGRPSEEDLTVDAITAACAGRSNVVYGGAYRSPADLSAIYGPVHFAWCIDYLDAGTNSEWLLPNRLYEGCLMGALALARPDTATSRMVERQGLGWTLAEPLEESVVRFLGDLDPEAYEKRRRGVAGMSRSMFVDLDDTRGLLERLDKLAGGKG
jgi:succinoglycan biosynthesis protein ExoL